LLAEYLAGRRGFFEDMGQLYSGRFRTGERRGAPPWRRVQRRKKARSALIAARKALDDSDLGLGDGAEEAAIEARKQARAALDVVIRNISVKIPGPKGNRNAEKEHIQFWRVLADHSRFLLQPGYSPKQLIAFIVAASTPVFPRETTAKAVSNFAYRFLKRPRI
jgi:hypothetical protein